MSSIEITEGFGKDVATDEIGGLHHQRVKLSLGAAGTANDAEAGAGAVGSGVQRMTLASDDPAVLSVGIMDDWDESDRCKVNLIVGQAGIAGGSGVVGATVMRVTLATDVALPTGSNTLGGVNLTQYTPSSGRLPVEIDAAALAALETITVAALTAALPAGDNNIGHVDVVSLPALAAGTANIGDVDVLTVPADPFGVNADAASATGSISAKLRFVAATGIPITSIVPGTAATNLGKAEDAAHASGDTGILVLTVRTDTLNPASLPTSATGDYAGLQSDNVGRLRTANTPEPDLTSDVYSVCCPAAAAGLSKNFLTLFNDDAAKKVDVLFVYIAKTTTAAVTGLIRGYALFRFTNATAPVAGGEARTIRRFNTALNAIDADITARTGVLSTIVLVGTTEAEALAWQGLNEEETGSGGSDVPLFDWQRSGAPIVLNTDEGIVVQQDATAGTGNVCVTVFFRVRTP